MSAQGPARNSGHGREEYEMTTYLVGIGGSSRDTWDEYEDLVDAEAACLRMAEEQAKDMDPVPEVDLWEQDGVAGMPSERGACPEGNCGGYWPYIVEV